MIRHQDQLDLTRSAIVNLERALQSLKRDVLPKNPKRFALMAEPAVAPGLSYQSTAFWRKASIFLMAS
jgi:hypothetical protein